MVLYIVKIKPFKEKLLNNLEVFNELCVLAKSYHLLLFTSLVADVEIKYKVGWSFIGVTAINILANMLVVIV